MGIVISCHGYWELPEAIVVGAPGVTLASRHRHGLNLESACWKDIMVRSHGQMILYLGAGTGCLKNCPCKSPGVHIH
jgi:hypothetical protein